MGPTGLGRMEPAPRVIELTVAIIGMGRDGVKRGVVVGWDGSGGLFALG